MKTIESSLIGRKSIVANDPNVQLFQVREVLNQHRDRLINRLLVDIPTYIDYKFKAKASNDELSEIKETLLNVTKTNVDLDKYHSVIRKILKRPLTRLTNEVFFSEIDDLIRRQISKPQLQLIR
jgi:hypothetical protein